MSEKKYFNDQNLTFLMELIKYKYPIKDHEFSGWMYKNKEASTTGDEVENYDDSISYQHFTHYENENTHGYMYIYNGNTANDKFTLKIYNSRFNFPKGFKSNQNYFIYKLQKNIEIDFDSNVLNEFNIDDDVKNKINFDKNLWSINDKKLISKSIIDILVIKISTILGNDSNDQFPPLDSTENGFAGIIIDILTFNDINVCKFNSSTIKVATGYNGNSPNGDGIIINKYWYDKYKDYVISLQYTLDKGSAYTGESRWDKGVVAYNNNGYPIYPQKKDEHSSYCYVTIELSRRCPTYREMFKDTYLYECDISKAAPPLDKNYSHMFENTKLSNWTNWSRANNVKFPDGANCTAMFKNCKQLQFIYSKSTRKQIEGRKGTSYMLWYNNMPQENFITWGKNVNWTSMFEGCGLRFVDLDDWVFKSENDELITAYDELNIKADRMFKGCFQVEGESILETTISGDEGSNLTSVTPKSTGVLRLPYMLNVDNTSSMDMFAKCLYLNFVTSRLIFNKNGRESSSKNGRESSSMIRFEFDKKPIYILPYNGDSYRGYASGSNILSIDNNIRRETHYQMSSWTQKPVARFIYFELWQTWFVSMCYFDNNIYDEEWKSDGQWLYWDDDGTYTDKYNAIVNWESGGVLYGYLPVISKKGDANICPTKDFENNVTPSTRHAIAAHRAQSVGDKKVCPRCGYVYRSTNSDTYDYKFNAHQECPICGLAKHEFKNGI